MLDHEDRIAALKISGAGVGTAATALTLNEWVAIATILYLLLQIGLLLPKYWQAVIAWLDKRK